MYTCTLKRKHCHYDETFITVGEDRGDGGPGFSGAMVRGAFDEKWAGGGGGGGCQMGGGGGKKSEFWAGVPEKK